MASAAPVIRLPLQTGQWAAASFTNDVIGTFWHMDSVCQETWTKCGPYASRIKSNLITYEHKIFQHGTANALCRHRNIRYHFQSRMALYSFCQRMETFLGLFLVGDNIIVLTFRNSTWVIYKKKHCFSLKVRNRTVAQCRLYFGLHISPSGFCELYNWKDFQGHSFELRECIGGIANVTFLSRAQLPYS